MIFEWKVKMVFIILEVIEIYVLIYFFLVVLIEFRVGVKCDWVVIRIGGNRKSNCFSNDRVWK